MTILHRYPDPCVWSITIPGGGISVTRIGVFLAKCLRTSVFIVVTTSNLVTLGGMPDAISDYGYNTLLECISLLDYVFSSTISTFNCWFALFRRGILVFLCLGIQLLLDLCPLPGAVAAVVHVALEAVVPGGDSVTAAPSHLSRTTAASLKRVGAQQRGIIFELLVSISMLIQLYSNNWLFLDDLLWP